MIMLGVSHAAATVVAAVAGFIKAVGFMTAQTVIVLGVSHTAATVVAPVARFI